MFILYDTDTDTLQTRTRRYDRDRHLARVIIPTWWDDTDVDIALPVWASTQARTLDDCDTLLDAFHL